MATKKHDKLSKDLLHELFEYKDGELYWKKRPSLKAVQAKIGNKAGTICNNLYKQVSINKEYYYIHRIIFAMFYGYFPNFVDHIDGNPSNNKIENLREATQTQNNYNAVLKSNNTSGYKNVYWDKRSSKWLVMVKVERKNKHIGYFDNILIANNAAIMARKQYYGEFTRDND
jgi:hypothetical protein